MAVSVQNVIELGDVMIFCIPLLESCVCPDAISQWFWVCVRVLCKSQKKCDGNPGMIREVFEGESMSCTQVWMQNYKLTETIKGKTD
jgi:hypothetical protein